MTLSSMIESIPSNLVPSAIDFYLTMDCSDRCQHCYALPRYVDPDNIPKDYRWLEIPLPFVKKIVSQAAVLRDQFREQAAKENRRNGILEKIRFFGGEPFLRYEELLLPALSTVLEHGFFATVITNGFWGKDIEKAFEKLKQINDLTQIFADKGQAIIKNADGSKDVYRPSVSVKSSFDGFRTKTPLSSVVNITDAFIKGNFPNLSLGLGTMLDIDELDDKINSEAQREFFKQCRERGIEFPVERKKRGMYLTAFWKDGRLVSGNFVEYFPQRGTPDGRMRNYILRRAKEKGLLKEAIQYIKKYDDGRKNLHIKNGFDLVFVPIMHKAEDFTTGKESPQIAVKACIGHNYVAGKRGVLCENMNLKEMIQSLGSAYPSFGTSQEYANKARRSSHVI